MDICEECKQTQKGHWHGSEEVFQEKEKLDKAKNNKNINHSLSKNGIYANSKNTQKIMKDKQDQIDLENYETRRKEIENLNRQASAS